MIVVAGESLVDLTPARCGGEAGYVPRAGGSPFNVAVGLGRLGVPVEFLGRTSADAFGRMLREHLHASGAGTRWTATGPEPTPLAVVSLGGGEPEYAFYMDGTADRLLSPADLPALPDGAWLHVGSLALVLEPGATTLTDLVAAQAGRRLVSLDPNVRPAFLGDPAAYLGRLHGWLAGTDLVKVSAADLGWLHPGRAAEDVAAEWLGRGPAAVVVTAGADGATAFTPAGAVHRPSPAVEVVDTVGAGDAFTAGTLARLHGRGVAGRADLAALDGAAWADVLEFAARVAALTCARAGADPPRLAELGG